jgi:hypothetical protein
MAFYLLPTNASFVPTGKGFPKTGSDAPSLVSTCLLKIFHDPGSQPLDVPPLIVMVISTECTLFALSC